MTSIKDEIGKLLFRGIFSCWIKLGEIPFEYEFANLYLRIGRDSRAKRFYLAFRKDIILWLTPSSLTILREE